MYTEELVKLLIKNRFTRDVFCGVIPIDKLPIKKINKMCAFIVNTDESNLPGEHWFAIFVPKNGPIEYFDSYGIPPYHKEIYDFFKVNKRRFIYNNIQIQHNNSINCGKFALYYIYFRAKGYTMKQYLKFFNIKYLLYNDKFLNKLHKLITKF